MNKIEKARVITQALLNLGELPAPNHHRVKKVARKNGTEVNRLYGLAQKVLKDRSPSLPAGAEPLILTGYND